MLVKRSLDHIHPCELSGWVVLCWVRSLFLDDNAVKSGSFPVVRLMCPMIRGSVVRSSVIWGSFLVDQSGLALIGDWNAIPYRKIDRRRGAIGR